MFRRQSYSSGCAARRSRAYGSPHGADTQLWKLVPHAVGNQVATGDSSWTLFLSSRNFKGPVAFFPPTTWSRISAHNLPAVGRGLDSRAGTMGSGAMEFATVPGLQADFAGATYSRIPKLAFPTETQNNRLVTPLMQDLTVYSRQAIYGAMMSWFANGPIANGAFARAGAATNSFQSANDIAFDQGDKKQILAGISDLVQVIDLSGANSCSWGLLWKDPPTGSGFLKGNF